jgi:hypothetical protein
MSVTVCLDPIRQASQLRIREQLPPTLQVECSLVFGGVQLDRQRHGANVFQGDEHDKFVRYSGSGDLQCSLLFLMTGVCLCRRR